MPTTAGAEAVQRLPVLDLVRGVAVLGILAINLGGFAGPIAATLSPNLPEPGSFADEAWFSLMLLLFEGKMRALFSLLFGASLLLFIDRADARGEPGEVLQFRRLGWLALFGYLHFLLFWWGDILFTYALAGLAALAFRQANPRWLLAGGVLLLAGWHLSLTVDGAASVTREYHVLTGTAPAEVARTYHQRRAAYGQDTAEEVAGTRQGFLAQIRHKLATEPDEPLSAALNTIGESLPLMLIGMALYRLGFYGGTWPRARLRTMVWGGIGSGGVATVLFIGWAWPMHFPPVLMLQGIGAWLALPHLLMALGYAAGLVLIAPRLIPTRLGTRLIAAGRIAFTNYLGMTMVMTALFYGWGLNLVGRVPEHWHWPFLLGGWALMLGWSAPWLHRFRHGPLEWLWRCLTYWRITPLRR